MPILTKRKSPLKDQVKVASDKGKHAQVVSCEKDKAQTGENLYIVSVEYCSR